MHVLTGSASVGASMLEASRCGGLLAVAGAAGGVRVYETRSWCWESRPTLCEGAPCVAAAWQGPPPLSDGAKTLVLAFAGSPALHLLRFGYQRMRVSAGPGGFSSGYGENARSEYASRTPRHPSHPFAALRCSSLTSLTLLSGTPARSTSRRSAAPRVSASSLSPATRTANGCSSLGPSPPPPTARPAAARVAAATAVRT